MTDDLIERLERGAVAYMSASGPVYAGPTALEAEAARALRASAGREMVTEDEPDGWVDIKHATFFTDVVRTDGLEPVWYAPQHRSTPEGWQSMETAPAACHFFATYWDDDCAEWIVGIVALPTSGPWTHWQPLPAAPTQGGGE